MKFTVIWKPSASDELIEVWLAATSVDRAPITAATHTIDQLLRSDPDAVGESRSGQARILFVEPLVVTYEVHLDDRKVFVLAVHRPPHGR
jgi:hypothetical protein